MRHLKFKILSFLLAIVTIVTIIHNAIPIEATEFAGNETYWTQTCSTYQSDPSVIKTCNEYKDYLNTLKDQKLSESADTQKKIDSLNGDLLKMGELANSYNGQIESVSAEIETITSSIATMEENITIVEGQIIEQTALVNSRKEEIKKRMVRIQRSINTNEYVNFVMGSEDLVDFIQRSESLSTFTDNDNKQIDLLKTEITKLEEQKTELSRIQETNTAQKAVLEKKKNDIVALQNEAQTVVAALEVQQSSLSADKIAADNAANGISSLMPSMPALSVTPEPSNPGDDGNTGGGNTEGSNNGNLNWSRNWYGGNYTSPFNIFSVVGLTGQCTWYCFGRATEVNGSYLADKIPRGNAQNWYTQASANGLAVGQSPKQNSIIVWGFGQYGHVAFVESYDPSTGMITISEGNVNAPGGGLGYNTSLEVAIQYAPTTTLSLSSLIGQRGAPVGYIYF